MVAVTKTISRTRLLDENGMKRNALKGRVLGSNLEGMLGIPRDPGPAPAHMQTLLLQVCDGSTILMFQLDTGSAVFRPEENCSSSPKTSTKFALWSTSNLSKRITSR
ncbi:hypothetical protein CALCODRAFT_145611 [Calocera cornea HHB12733]|uniref:Uncharacterized protein n=1 Tax=Calocera cornea HHB12733 TaxID=1353952 RepID=A0A165CS31_9BASI|nr:hypothetical protein CALCODRAFT_145611 [Calocera cornea HHB12733]